MNRMILVVMVIFALATGAQAKNQIYGVPGGSIAIAGEGYKLFVSDKILDTVERIDAGKSKDIAGYCKSADENTSKSLGEAGTLRSDDRLSIPAGKKISYSAACLTYSSMVKQLKTADDVRKLWLLFGDSATDDFAVETLKKGGGTEELDKEAALLIESKRLTVVSKYIEFFYTRNKEWKLTDYTFLSQTFKSRKDKALSPAFGQFIEALLTGDKKKASQIVKSIDLENLGVRFIPSDPRDRMKEVKDHALTQGKK
jgi:hypothetical protein